MVEKKIKCIYFGFIYIDDNLEYVKHALVLSVDVLLIQSVGK